MHRSMAEWVALAVPPLLLAGLGLAHPADLTTATAASWQTLHVVLLPLFPLLALAPWIVVRREHRELGWVVAVLGLMYSVFYTALDVLAGIGAGALERAGASDEWVSVMFAQGNDLALYGVWAYFAATLVAAGTVLARARLRALPGTVIVLGGAWSFLSSHIYWPGGVLTMIALAIGWAALFLAGSTPAESPVPAGGRGATV